MKAISFPLCYNRVGCWCTSVLANHIEPPGTISCSVFAHPSGELVNPEQDDTAANYKTTVAASAAAEVIAAVLWLGGIA